MDVDDLQNIINNKEMKNVQFLDGRQEVLGGYSGNSQKSTNQPTSKSTNRQSFKERMSNILKAWKETWGF